MSATSDLVELYRRDRYRAHEGLFERRHESKTPKFHRQLIRDLWESGARRVIVGFRGSSKSTRAEEMVAICAVEPFALPIEPVFRNCLFLGPSESRAIDRLSAVVNELKTNDVIRTLYGDVIGQSDAKTKLELKDKRVIQAKGVEQDIRGMKHLDWRPDLIVVDDFEDQQNVLTAEAREKMMRRFLGEIRLACDMTRVKIIVLCTIIDPECVPLRLAKEAKWPISEYPIAYRGESGDLISIWPSRYPMSLIEQTRSEFTALGQSDIFDMEMMCERVAPGNRIFNSGMMKVEPVEHTFQAKYVMIDPARTKNRGSDATGWAVWSWERNKLIIWDAGAEFLMPNEVIDLAFRLSLEHNPIYTGIEDTGLHEWLSQSMRASMVERGAIPYRAVPASKGQDGLIRGLQDFASRGEMVFARDLPVLRDQFLAFPNGKRDAINALAYCLETRPGRLIYDGWKELVHIAPVTFGAGSCYLAANATRSMVTGIIVQLRDGRVTILSDFVAEGDPGEAAQALLRNSSMFSGRGLTVIVGPHHFDQWNNIGLVQAIRNLGVECRPGGSLEGGKNFLRTELSRLPERTGGVAVSPEATWTLRAFAGGYSRPLHHGILADEPTNNQYRVLMEGLESLCGLFAWGSMNEDKNFAFDREGRPYLSIIPQRDQVNAQSRSTAR